jgi:Mn-dependent DtxR family transcriptional regulator
MDVLASSKDPKSLAEDYVEIYTSLQQALYEGKIETTDVEQYLSFKEHMLSSEAKKLAHEMIDNM